MKIIKIIAETDNRTTDWLGRARKETKKIFARSQEQFNDLAKMLNGKKIEIKRITQAIEVFYYSHANFYGQVPAYWTASLEEIWDEKKEEYKKDEYRLILGANYRKEDYWRIIE